MQGQIPLESAVVVDAANHIRRHFDSCNMSVPQLKELLLGVVAMKIAPQAWQKLLNAVVPQAAGHFARLTENATYMSHELTSNPIAAMHVLALAPVSETATTCQNFMDFVSHLGYTTPTPALQMMFLSLGVWKEARSNIWESTFMSETLGKPVAEIRRQIVPKVDEFYKQINVAELPNDFALLLSGIQFDQNKLDKSTLANADFPCQRPRISKPNKQNHRADFRLQVQKLADLKPSVDPTAITAEDRATMKELRKMLDNLGEHSKFSEVDAAFKKALAIEKRWTSEVPVGSRLVDLTREKCQSRFAPYNELCSKVDREFLRRHDELYRIQLKVPSRETLMQMSVLEMQQLEADLKKRINFLKEQPMVK